ncbi:MAG: SPFH domain-containing protein [Peptococcaceae bacterium]|nr:SPFH domain-containing protein [Peptococcaceae bacterium]
MGLNRIGGALGAGIGAVGGVLADTWKDYFVCDAMAADELVRKGEQHQGRRGVNRKGSENIITTGSVIVVAEGQCMLIVDQGKIVEFCAEPGAFEYDASTEPSLFCGDLKKGLIDSFKLVGKRFTFGAETAHDQRVYYVNTKEIIGNKYGTASPVPFRVVDANIGLDVDIAIKCFGEYSYKITDPLLFYANVVGNITDTYTRDAIDSQLKTELLTALQPAFAKLSAQGIRYSALPAHTAEIADALNDILSEKWGQLRGLSVVSFGVSSVSASEEDAKLIKEIQRNAALRDPRMAAAHLTGAQAEAMQTAAANEGGMGAIGAFMGMGMAQNATGNTAANLFGMAQQQQPAQAQAAGWTCPSCGQAGNTGKFCTNCGQPNPVHAAAAAVLWTCPACGTQNSGKFCSECGAPRPQPARYACNKCGWVPEDPTHPPKFCPECGDPFNDDDIQRS